MTLGIFSSCTNAGWSFPNFPYTTTYFPNQFPIRTLIFGDYNYDNTRDNNLQFLISATTGGVYKQTKNITCGIQVDNTLTNNLFTTSSPVGGTQPIKPLPSGWYTLTPSDQIVIPSGRYDGGTLVQLTTDFTADTNSINPYWVIPLRMTSTTADSILSGKSGLANPDPRIAGNWALIPKNFTLFCVRYVNEWHGRYLLRGTDVVKKVADGSTIETIYYHTQYLEGNTVVPVTTFRRNQVLYENAVKRTGGSPGNFQMKLTFDPASYTGSPALATTGKYPTRPVAGSVKFVRGKDSNESWGNIPRQTIYLAYTITVGAEIHNCNDTLVYRDKNVIYADFVPKIVLP